MGKNKAQRTKNNAKPSNSSRSAELLGTTMPNFVGFSAVKDGGGYVPVLPGLSLGGLNDVEINAIESNFQLVFKKMNKKDATTKFKALQEFSQLCRDSTLQSVEAVLPFWPRSYCLLCTDVEHKVREAAQLAHSALVKRVGRNIAVYLKQIAGPWFVSQFDTYPPAASAATNSFQDTFPQRKIVDAIVHCQEEILSYIGDTITVQTAQSMSTHKALTAEVLEAKYQKVLIASLRAYRSYLKKVPPAQIEKTEKCHQRIIGCGKFWKLPKHESLLVKTAFFNVLASIIENATTLLNEEKKRAMTAIVNSLDETEPNLLSAVWESMLVAIYKIEDWHLSVSIEKLVLPKLWKVLKTGGQSCATVVYPNLLPFVSQFSKFNINNGILFSQFFSNMRLGFHIKSVQTSRSETLAVTKSFVECMRYAILLNKNDPEMCEEILKQDLMAVIEFCIVELSGLKSVLFCEVTRLIRYWSKNRQSPECETYGKLVQIFWRELESMFTTLSLRTSDESSNIHENQIELLVNLKNAPTHSRKNLRVKFSEIDDPVEAKPETDKIAEIVEDPIFLAELDLFVNGLCISLDGNARESSDEHIVFLNRLVSNFESQRLFAGIATAYRGNADLFEFYDKVLKKWLLERRKATDSIVQLIFTSLRYMDDSRMETVFKSITELNDSRILTSTLICALSERHRNDSRVIESWCLESCVTERLSHLARNIGTEDIAEKTNDDETILVMSFTPTSDGGLRVSEDAIANVATILCDRIAREESSRLTSVVDFVTRLLAVTWNHKNLTDGSVKMVKSLFALSLRDPLNSIEASAAFMDSIRNTWKCSFVRAKEQLTSERLLALRKECIDVIHEKMYSSYDPQVEDAIVDIAIDFFEATSNLDAIESLSLAIGFIHFHEQWIPQVLALVLYGEIISGNFYLSNPLRSVSASSVPIEFVALKDEAMPDQTENCLKWASFTSKLLAKMIDRLNEDDANDQVDSGVIDGLADLPYVLNYIILVASLGLVYRRHYKTAKNYQRIDATLQILVAECAKLRQTVPKEIWRRILTDSLSVDESWLEYGSLFSEFLRIFYGSDQHLSEVKLNGRQILLDYLDTEDKVPPLLGEDIRALAVARNILNDEIDTPECIRVLERMIKRHEDKSTYLLLDRDTSVVEWSELVLPLEIIRLLAKFVRIAPTKVTAGLWDAIIVLLPSWQLTVDRSKHRHEDAKVRAVIVAVAELYHEVQSLMNRQKRNSIDGLPTTLLDEWTAVFADDTRVGVLNTWSFYASLYNEKSDRLTPGIVLDSLGRAISVTDGACTSSRSTRVISKETFRLALDLLPSPVSSLQLAGYHLISREIPDMVERDKILLEGADTCEPKDLNIRKFEDVLSSTQKIVNAMLMGFKLCDTASCTVQPHTDSYTYTIAYLLAWANVFDMCAHAHADLRYQYAEFLKDDYFPSLLNNIFRLMPVEVLQDNKSKTSNLLEIFSTWPSLEFGESWTEWRLDHIVCWLYTNSLRHLPVLVRQWWGTADSRISAAVEKITTVYVSPMLCQEELTNNRLADFENMQVKVLPYIREVVAVYQMDDTKLELSMVLPTNYPLEAVTVERGRNAGGDPNWRNCYMQPSIFLTHQNGTIWDGLLMWKRNLDKKFAGVEECFICYSIFHMKTYQIPKLSCHTCRKKFHAPCLYKWFTTSQKSTCPICRNIF